MKQRFLLVLSALLTTALALAGPVSKEEAKSKAAEFMSSRYAASRGTASTAEPRLVLDRGDYFVFNMGTDDGFVIVCGDDRAPAILAYSDRGTFDAQNIPTNMQAFLQGYADEIQHMPETAAARAEAPKKVVRSSISPMLMTQWNQHAPYNDQCPVFSGNHAVTGCVATAMAQVMNYHQFPIAETVTIPSYELSGYGTVVGKAPTTFDWNNMFNSYLNGEDGTEVAKLMSYCGVAVRMAYDTSASSANNYSIIPALVNYFGYDPDAVFAQRSDYDYRDWVGLLYTELASDRPVLMCGQSTGGGHAFVCDGYDEDDFFHINWGWGGSSDGYFRLSNLTPSTQGAGGSSTGDGYNLTLGACIGVKPNDGVDGSVRLTNTAISWGEGSEYYAWTRMGNGNFQIYPCYTFSNHSGKTASFNYGLRLLKDGITITDFVLSEESAVFANYSGITSWRTIQFGDGLGDGTYKLIGICQSGSDEWVACEGADDRYIECVISGDNLTATIKEPVAETPNLTVTGVAGADALAVGQEQELTVSVTNSGTGAYHGDITVAFTWSEGGTSYISKLGGATVDINAGQSKDVTIAVNPPREGEFTLNVYRGLFNAGTTLYSQSASVGAGSSTADLAYSGLTIENSSGSTVYGNNFKGCITVKNDDSKAYNQGLSITLGKTYNWVDNGGGTWAFNYSVVGNKSVNDVIAVGESKTLDFDFRGLEYGERYVLLVAYSTYKGSVKTNHQSSCGVFTIGHGFVTVDANGNVTASAPTASVTIPADAVAVDLRGQTTVTSVTPNSNPNCIYMLDAEAAVPAGISGKNIVKGGSAATISLTDGHDFVTPEPFTAATVSYSRTFTTGSNGTGGWTTLVVPFDVDKVTVDGVEKTWFKSATDNGHFWVRKFVNDGSGSVTFDYTDKIEANTPYIIAVPDGTWGEANRLTGKTLVFTGTDQTVASEKAVASGDFYRFTGTAVSVMLNDIYALNAAGTSFVHGNATVDPFRAYFVASSISYSASALQIVMGENEPTGIRDVDNMPTNSAVYTLDGRRVSGSAKKGVYIINGKKVIK